ncbi:MAG: hypothetical protein H6732_19870 [Alphaproteobacteria bacterium]|nr:hypothetical protein [Alphaproteobacteria bacterium]
MRPIVLLAGLLAAAPAHAARHELSYEFLGAFTSDLTLGEVFDTRLPAFGLKAGGAVLRNGPRTRRFGLVIDGGWSRASRGSRVDLYSEVFDRNTPFGATLVVDTITLGAKADVSVADLFFPYIHVQAALLHGRVLTDSDPDDHDDPFVDDGLAPAGLFTFGFELGPPDTHLGWPVTFAFYLEAGVQIAGGMTVGALGGPVDLSGAVLRSGVGLRF